MGGQATDLRRQILQLPLVGSLQIRHRIAFREHIRQSLACGLPPFAQHRWRKRILRCALVERFGFLQQLPDNLGFEGGRVRLFHTCRVRNADRLTVQISRPIILGIGWYSRTVPKSASASRYSSSEQSHIHVWSPSFQGMSS